MPTGYLLGFDVGSSSVKASLLDAATGKCLATATSPKKELTILSPQPGYAEQHPDTWWEHIVHATGELRATAGISLTDVAAIGISYQMHGLVALDKNGIPVRNAIIWCDSRAVSLGADAFSRIGEKECLRRLLNSPGNFTASKCAWVKAHEPELYSEIQHIMLPGDYIAYKLTGDITTTASGLSEGILWDFSEDALASIVLDTYGISQDLIPALKPTFGIQGVVSTKAAMLLGVRAGIPVSYRGGDQPNNALSLNVLNPGEIAATAGTSGVVYGVTDTAQYDPQSRVNTFVHVNHTRKDPRYGVLLCVNGTGILNSWIKHQVATTGSSSLSYPELNALAAQAPVGADGLSILPYGNGAERTLSNANIGASVNGLMLTRHTRAHLVRAAQEGIVFALKYGIDIMRSIGVKVATVKAGHANMFLSPVFAETFATITNATVELYNTDGSQGAARGAGIGAGIYKDAREAFASLTTIQKIDPNPSQKQACDDAYAKWEAALKKAL